MHAPVRAASVGIFTYVFVCRCLVFDASVASLLVAAFACLPPLPFLLGRGLSAKPSATAMVAVVVVSFAVAGRRGYVCPEDGFIMGVVGDTDNETAHGSRVGMFSPLLRIEDQRCRMAEAPVLPFFLFAAVPPPPSRSGSGSGQQLLACISRLTATSRNLASLLCRLSPEYRCFGSRRPSVPRPNAPPGPGATPEQRRRQPTASVFWSVVSQRPSLAFFTCCLFKLSVRVLSCHASAPSIRQVWRVSERATIVRSRAIREKSIDRRPE